MSEWIKFDKEDSTTWPKNEEFVIVYLELLDSVFEARFYSDCRCFRDGDTNDKFPTITHWQPLPEPPTN